MEIIERGIMIRIAINGYGRIGRVAHRVILERFAKNIQVAAINAGSSTDIAGWMYLLKYDTVYGTLKHHAISFRKAEERPLDFETPSKLIGWLCIDADTIPVFSEKDPLQLPWNYLGVDVVIESTGAFEKEEDLKKHLTAGAKSVLLSAPFKGDTHFPTYVLGVNLQSSEHKKIEDIVSNASCTTNCIAPVAQVIEETLGIEKAMMTTVHGYTSDQRLHDGGHKDYRRARAAAVNIVPTSTGATRAAALAIPSLKDKFTGLALRVPVPVGSLSDFTFLVKRSTSIDEVNKLLTEASQDARWKDILAVTSDPLVSSDIIGETHSSIVDLGLTQVVGETMVKVVAWYDNEYGYANRLVEEAHLIGEQMTNF